MWRVRALLRQLDESQGEERQMAIRGLAYQAVEGHDAALLGLVERESAPDVRSVLASLDPHCLALAWYRTRDPRLARGGVAWEPTEARIVTGLKAGRYELTLPDAEAFLQASLDEDPEVAARARQIILGPLTPELLDGLSLAALSGEAGVVWLETGRMPADAGLRTVYQLLTGREQEAEESDPEGELLGRGLAQLSESVRLRVTAKLRERGRGHLTTVAIGLDFRQLERADRRFEELLAEMLRQERDSDLWRLAFLLPVHRTRAIVLVLGQRGFAGGGPLLEAALPLAAAPIPDPEPTRTTHGTFRCLGGERLLRATGGALICEEVATGDELWTAAGLWGGECSPDGRWLYTDRGLLGPEGRLRAFEGRAESIEFSPCSRYLLLQTPLEPSGRPVPGSSLYDLWKLEPLAAVLGGVVGWSWQWQDDRALLGTEQGWETIELETGEREALQVPFPPDDLLWARSPSGRRWATTNNATGTRVWDEGREHSLPGARTWFLPDDRIVLRQYVGGWSLWDGGTLHRLQAPAKARLDAPGARLLGGDFGATEIRRFHEPVLVRALGGVLGAFGGERVVTHHGDELRIWRVPYDFPLGTARLEDADRLELHDRELARLFLLERMRHDISLDDDLAMLGEFEVLLD